MAAHGEGLALGVEPNEERLDSREDGDIVDILGREENGRKSATNSSVVLALSSTYSSMKNGRKPATRLGVRMAASSTYSGVMDRRKNTST